MHSMQKKLIQNIAILVVTFLLNKETKTISVMYGSLLDLTPHAYIIGPSLNLLVQAMLILVPERWVAHQQDV